MIYTDVGCCCSLFDVVSSVVFSFLSAGIEANLSLFFVFFVCGGFWVFVFFFSPSLSLSPILLCRSSLFPFFVTFQQPFFLFLFIFPFSSFSLLFSLSPAACLHSVVSKMVYKIKWINYIKKKKNKKENKNIIKNIIYIYIYILYIDIFNLKKKRKRLWMMIV